LSFCAWGQTRTPAYALSLSQATYVAGSYTFLCTL
jgi:hypothetical protein